MLSHRRYFSFYSVICTDAKKKTQKIKVYKISD
jgi:hypothetical protein